MEEHCRLLELAAGGQLPERVDEQSTPEFDIFRELIEAGYLKAIDASHMGGRAYLDPRITLAGREYLQQQRTPMASPSGSTQPSIRLFISHKYLHKNIFISYP